MKADLDDDDDGLEVIQKGKDFDAQLEASLFEKDLHEKHCTVLSQNVAETSHPESAYVGSDHAYLEYLNLQSH